MQFSFTINKLAVFYFFVQNLSEWHFSNRKDYNILWRGELGQFSSEEEGVIKQLGKIHLRYPFGKQYLGRYFFLEENPWGILEQKISLEDFIILKDIFSILENKFNIFWKREEPLLLAWQIELSSKINIPPLIAQVVELLKVIFNTSPSEVDIRVNLLPSSPTHTGGGTNIDSKNISLEISRYPLQQINHAMSLVWHESIHLCFQKQYFLPLISEEFPDDQQKVDLISEIAIRSLFPRGILGIRLFKNKPRPKLMNETSPQQTIEFLNLAKEYIDNKKSFDKEYVQKMSRILGRKKEPDTFASDPTGNRS